MHTAGARDRIKFGRIYGGNQVAYGGNRRDYIYVVSVDQGKQIYRHELRVWRNDGEGGTKLRADGNRYCDMVRSVLRAFQTCDCGTANDPTRLAMDVMTTSGCEAQAK